MKRAHLAVLPTVCAEYIGYGRVSADEQAKGESVEHQSQWCDEEARRQGGILLAFFFDRPHTGTEVFGRPGFEAAVAFAAARGGGVILARDTSRLHRNGDEFREFERKVSMPANVRFRTNIGERGGRGVGAYVTTQAIDTAVTVYSMMLSDSTKDGKQRLVAQGYWPAPPPVGYMRREQPVAQYARQQRRFSKPEDRELVPDPHWAPIIRRIFEHVKAGGSKNSIAVALTNEGIPSPRSGEAWHKSIINKILRNPLYAGWIHQACTILTGDDGEPIRMRGEPLIDQETWQACQPRRNPGAPTREDLYIFKGKLVTSHFVCLAPARRKGQPLPLLCKTHDAGKYRPAHLLYHTYKAEPADELAQYFPWALSAADTDALLIERLIGHADSHPDITMRQPTIKDDEVELLKRSLAGKREQAAKARERRDAALDMRMRDAALEHEASLRKLEAEAAGLEQRLDALARRVTAAPPSELVNVLAMAWQRGDIEGCQRIVDKLVREVDCRVFGPPRQDDGGHWISEVSFDIYLRTETGGMDTTSACSVYSAVPALPLKHWAARAGLSVWKPQGK